MASYSLNDDEVMMMHERLARELVNYAESRKRDVQRGAETPELAAEMVNKWAEGAQAALRTIEFPRGDYGRLADQLVLEIDPHFSENRQRRFKARPASLWFGPAPVNLDPVGEGPLFAVSDKDPTFIQKVQEFVASTEDPEYKAGYDARLSGHFLDVNASENWREGWTDADNRASRKLQPGGEHEN